MVGCSSSIDVKKSGLVSTFGAEAGVEVDADASGFCVGSGRTVSVFDEDAVMQSSAV
jgi:hypothetical protein